MIDLESYLKDWDNVELLERYDMVISLTEAIKFGGPNQIDFEKIPILLNAIEKLRFAFGHNKGTEGTSAQIDRTLAIAALSIAVKYYKGIELKKYIDSVNYYESDVRIKEIHDRLMI